MTTRYLDLSTFKQWWKTEKVADDGLITEAINAAEMAIDNALMRRMQIAGATASPRVYRPSPGARVLFIDDATEITSISESGTTLTVNTDCLAEPLNGLSGAGEPWPFTQLRRLSGGWYTNDALATITVTAKWGWPAIPPQVVESCKIIASDMLGNRFMRQGLVDVTDAGGVGSRENRTVRDMVAKYRSVRTWGLA
jgi:hypothetical protein